MEQERCRFVCAFKGNAKVADEPNEPQTIDFVVRRLMKETGVTEEQARKLVSDLGYQWASLLREARFLAKKR